MTAEAETYTEAHGLGILPTRVVVPLDGSTYAQRAMAPAAALARRFGCELRVVGTTFDAEPEVFQTYLEDRAERSGIDDAGAVLMERRFPGTGIADFVDERPGSLLVMSTHGRGTARQLVLGSTAEEVLRLSRAPVVLVGPAFDASVPAASDARQGQILLCDDGSSGAGAVVPTASAWARHLGWGIDLVSVVPDGADPDATRSAEIADLIQSGGVPVTVTTLEGASSVSNQIVAEAVDRDADLIAMGTHGGGQHVVNSLGSTVGAVVRSSPVPVLVRRR